MADNDMTESSGHVHGCRHCNRELDVSTPRAHVRHYGVRFGDIGLVVSKNGMPLDDCVEVDLAGGRAVRLSRPYHLCNCSQRTPCLYVDTGSFSVNGKLEE
jgi:hypothetical protein